MIVGLGVELVDVPRFEAVLARFGDRFTRRLFTPSERAYVADRARGGAESLAVRFAAKVAARRALGRPGRARLAFTDIEIVREGKGAPVLRFHGGAEAASRALGVERTALTLTHDAQWCIGQVVLEGGSR